MTNHWQYSSIGLDNGLAPSRRQAIIWPNDDYIPDTYICVTRPQWVEPASGAKVINYRQYGSEQKYSALSIFEELTEYWGHSCMEKDNQIRSQLCRCLDIWHFMTSLNLLPEPISEMKIREHIIILLLDYELLNPLWNRSPGSNPDKDKDITWIHQCLLLLTWFNFNPSMDK